MQIITGYIDAASMSMVFAAVAGVAVTIGTVVAVYFRRAKKTIADKLGIDENQKKEVEADVTGSFGDNQ
ncbi:MAG: hypothetical protein E7563_06750 [Ruminococcaceae bacterium]|nr:hypothetical protein [Oscillospiraceae bacterium]